MRLPLLAMGLNESYAFRQTQTTMVVREFMRSGFDALSPLPVLGPPWVVPMEFPLFQLVSSQVGLALGMTPAVATRLTGLVFFQLTAVLVVVLARRWFSAGTAVVALSLYEFLPFGMQWGHAALIEFMATFLALAAVLLVDGSSPRIRPVLLASAVLPAVPAFLVKPTTALVLAPLFLVPLLRPGAPGTWPFIRRSLLLLLPAMCGVAAAAAWTRVADASKAGSEYTAFLTSSALATWNFGTWGMRYSLDVWRQVATGWEAIAGGTLILLVAVIVVLIGWRRSVPAVVVAAIPFLAVLVFPNLYFVHTYYSSAIYPVFTVLLAAAIVVAARRSRRPRTQALIGLLAGAVVVTVAWMSGMGWYTYQNLRAEQAEPELAGRIADAVPVGQGVVIVGCDWDPTVPFFADRRALMLRESTTLPVPARWIPGELGFLAYCGMPESLEDRPPGEVLPAGVRAVPLSEGIFRIEAG